ncbi:hypothetical protein NKG05_02160 [Oerskovia sp. M15]
MGAIGLGVTWAIVGFVTERQLKTPATLRDARPPRRTCCSTSRSSS